MNAAAKSHDAWLNSGNPLNEDIDPLEELVADWLDTCPVAIGCWNEQQIKSIVLQAAWADQL